MKQSLTKRLLNGLTAVGLFLSGIFGWNVTTPDVENNLQHASEPIQKVVEHESQTKRVRGLFQNLMDFLSEDMDRKEKREEYEANDPKKLRERKS